MDSPPLDRRLDHERIANEAKHWVRLTAACNSRCIFCLDAEAQDGRILDWDSVCREIRRGREEKNATRVVLSGGEASLHPRFHDFIHYSRAQGYTWIQTVTNGRLFGKREFFLKAADAGLSEITFSLHGHTAALHDHLTGAPGSFEQLLRAMMRAVRDGRVIVNVDVVINKQNVEHLEKIVALCAQLGVREYDLLHVIPQGEAFEHRDLLFYDVDAHAESLKRVFRLAKNPAFHVWTNRFPLAHLEDMEELIQDPHKMLDEVGGRRMQFRRYLDEGKAIDCRHPERCPHCFIEPFCSSLDRHIADMQAERMEVFWIGDGPVPTELPLGTSYLGCSVLPEAYTGPLYLKMADYQGIVLPPHSRVVVTEVSQLEALQGMDCTLEIHINKALAAHLIAHPEIIDPARWILHGPTYATMEQSLTHSPDWTALFAALPKGLRVQNLPPCLCPDSHLERPLRILDAHTFHQDGRTAIDPFVEQYISKEYRAKSLRCRACPVAERCRGGHLQHLRHAGFRILRPLQGAWAEVAQARLKELFPEIAPSLAQGAPPLPPAPRVALPDQAPVPEIDILPGRRS